MAIVMDEWNSVCLRTSITINFVSSEYDASDDERRSSIEIREIHRSIY